MNKKKILIISLAVVVAIAIAVAGILVFGKKDCEHQWSNATCSAPKTCSLCGATEGEALTHNYTLEIINESTLKSGATCSSGAVYYKSCEHCQAKSPNESDVFVNATSQLEHSYTAEEVKDEALIAGATCQGAALYYKSCSACGAVSTSMAQTFISGEALAHTYDQEVVASTYLKSGATCDSSAVYYKSCSCGAFSKDADAPTFTNGEALDHNYQLVDVDEATCESAQINYYECSRCDDSYSEEIGTANGHDIQVEDRKSDNPCVKERYRFCTECDFEEFIEEIALHSYTATLEKEATCSEGGQKRLTCSVCGEEKFEDTDPDVENGHIWTLGEVSDNKRIDTCEYCDATKSVTVFSGTETGAVKTDDLKDTEIALENANMTLDQGVIDAIKEQTDGKDISISAGTVDKEELGLTDEQKNQIGENKVYNFTITDSDDNPVAEFGKDNYITITLPYKLQNDEDVDSIAVWFISDRCHVEDCENGDSCDVPAHKLVSIDATYHNGFVTFVTNHFSYYTVTRLTPAERCALYGHSFVETEVEGSCLRDGYIKKVCVRCHEELIDITYEAPGAHNYEEVITPATCLTAGSAVYTCLNEGCGHSYTVRINALGHDYDEDVTPATCTASGSITYTCSRDDCDSSYTEVIVKLPHELNDTVVGATCLTDGYTIHKCANCDYQLIDAYVPALSHSYVESAWTWAENNLTATVKLTCSRADCNGEITLSANVVKKVENGTCSEFVRTTYTATVSYGGNEYTDEKIIEVGNPNHVYGSEWISDGNKHWHECRCGAKSDVTDHSFAIKVTPATCVAVGTKQSTCEICDYVHTETLPMLGHDYVYGVCANCGATENDNYYLNLVESWKNINGFAIEISGLSFVLSEKDAESLELLDIEGKIEQIDIAKLMLYVENGELYGAAKGSISIYNGPYNNQDAIYALEAIIEDDFVYAVISLTVNDVVVESAAGKFSIDYVLSNIFGLKTGRPNVPGMGMVPSSTLPIWLTEFLPVISEEILPLIEQFKDDYAGEINGALEKIFNLLFTFESQADGSVVASFDMQKVLTLHKHLNEKSIKELVNSYVGEGSFEAVVDFAKEILALKISEVPAWIEAKGVDYDELVAQINSLAKELAGAPNEFDVNDIITDEDYADLTLGFMLFQEEEYEGYIDEVVTMLEQASLYSLLMPNEAVEEIDYVLDIINELDFNISFTTNAFGMIQSINLSADNCVVIVDEWNGNIEEAEFSFNLDLTVNGKFEPTWSDIVDEINDNIVLPSDEMLGENSIYCEHNGMDMGSINYNNDWYDYSGLIFSVYETSYDELLGIACMPDCGDWKFYSTLYEEKCYRFMLATIEVNGESKNLIWDLYAVNPEVVEIIPSESGITAIYPDGSSKEISVDLNEAGNKIYAKIFLSVFDNAEYVNYDYDGFEYYYNAVTGEYAEDSAHNYEIADIEVEGEDCDNGYTLTYSCTICGDSYIISSSWHDTVILKEEIDLSEYGCECGGTAILYACPCGEKQELRINSECEFDYEWGNVWIEDALSDNDNITGNYASNDARIYTCAVISPECGFKYRYAQYYLAEDGCMAYEYVTYQFGYNEQEDKWLKEYTFKTGDSIAWHGSNASREDLEYKEGDLTVTGYKYTCSECRSSYTYVNYYDSEGNHVKSQTIRDNKLSIGDRYYEEVYEYAYLEEYGSYTSRHYYRYVYQDGRESWREYLYTYDYDYVAPEGYTEGYARTEECLSSSGEHTLREYAYAYYNGRQLKMYEYYTDLNSDYWYKYDYSYSFDGRCIQYESYTHSSGKTTYRENNYCSYSHSVIIAPTCTQSGLEGYHCIYCGWVGEEAYEISPNGHSWTYVDEEIGHICVRCGLQNANGADGKVVIEDLTVQYGNGENYVAGYYDASGVGFTHFISLILADGEEVVLEGVEIWHLDDINAYAFSKAQVEELALSLGYSAGEYEVRFAFVPYDDDGSLDYAITFNDDVFDLQVSNTSHFAVFVGQGKRVSITIVPEVTGTWKFTSISGSDTYGYLYDAYGNQIASNDDGGYNSNFLITYDLTAGNVYTLEVRWYHGDRYGYMPLAITAPQPPIEVTGSAEYEVYLGEGEVARFAITPEISGTWEFTSFADMDTVACLYDAYGNQLVYNDDGGDGNNFLISYYLEAGNTYVLAARWYSGDSCGYMPIVITAPEVQVAPAVNQFLTCEGGGAHQYELVSINLADFGACGGTFECQICSVCDMIYDVGHYNNTISCNFEVIINESGINEDGSEFYILEEVCKECGLCYVVNLTGTWDAGCYNALAYECFSIDGKIVVDYYIKQVQVYEDAAIDLTFNEEQNKIIYLTAEEDCIFELTFDTEVTCYILLTNEFKEKIQEEEIDGSSNLSLELTSGNYFLYIIVNEQPSSGHVFVNINKI